MSSVKDPRRAKKLENQHEGNPTHKTRFLPPASVLLYSELLLLWLLETKRRLPCRGKDKTASTASLCAFSDDHSLLVD